MSAKENDLNVREKELKQVRDEIIQAIDSPLFKYRQENNYQPVIGEGNHQAKIMFIGEAPGLQEAKTARPFCGRAGKLLDELLNSINLSRNSIYITNILKDRPPSNRDPESIEIDFYAPFLNRQINIIKPVVIVTLGRFSMNYILTLFKLTEEIKPISAIAGEVFTAQADYGAIKIIPLYHPAAAIYNQKLKITLLNDIKILLNYV